MMQVSEVISTFFHEQKWISERNLKRLEKYNIETIRTILTYTPGEKKFRQHVRATKEKLETTDWKKVWLRIRENLQNPEHRSPIFDVQSPKLTSTLKSIIKKRIDEEMGRRPLF